MGRATLYHLAQRGRRVLGLEQYASGHTLGSSHGDSRIIREMYFEHPLYVPLVQRAYDLWRELEERSGSALMTITGGLMIGPETGSVVTGTLKSAIQHSLPHEVLSAAQTRARFPEFRFGDELVAVLDPHAGYLDPEACNTAHLQLAVAAGAEAHFEERVTKWGTTENGVEITTASSRYRADQLVIAAGGWAGKLLPDLALPLSIERQAVFWLDSRDNGDRYDRSRFPIYAYEYTPGSICYGFPRLARGMKAAVMHNGETADDPAKIRRTIDDADIRSLRAALRPVLPGLASAPVLDNDTCTFTNTPDHDFIIDFHPRHPRVLVSSPCSGHGFKFASAIGELQAGLLIDGAAKFDLSPFRISRFVS